MYKQRLRNLVYASLIIFALSLSACTRSASTPEASPEAGEVEGTQSDTQATMDAVRSAILTQTAQASEPVTDMTIVAPEESGTPVITGTPPTATPEATSLVGVTEYTVVPGDWIWKIARKYYVDPQDIIDLNDLASPSQIQPGLVLKIPGPAPVEASETPSPTITITVTGTPGTTPEAGGTVHVVQPGEWIWQIARIYGVDPQDIIDANSLTDPSQLTVGQELVIP
jgi:LysM repeat protein